jgi:hypothetical protein
MGRARDIASLLTTSSVLATDAEVASLGYLTNSSASSVYLTQGSASSIYRTIGSTGLVKIVPSSVAVGSGTGSVDSLGTVTFSGVSSISLNNAFSATYKNYRIILSFNTSTAVVGTRFRLRASGTDNTSSNYYIAAISKDSSVSTINNENADPTTSYRIGTAANNFSSMSLEIHNPFASDYTSMHNITGALSNTNESHWFTGGGGFSGTTSFDGITFFLDSGTLTGTISIYGYTN